MSFKHWHGYRSPAEAPLSVTHTTDAKVPQKFARTTESFPSRRRLGLLHPLLRIFGHRFLTRHHKTAMQSKRELEYDT